TIHYDTSITRYADDTVVFLDHNLGHARNLFCYGLAKEYEAVKESIDLLDGIKWLFKLFNEDGMGIKLMEWHNIPIYDTKNYYSLESQLYFGLFGLVEMNFIFYAMFLGCNNCLVLAPELISRTSHKKQKEGKLVNETESETQQINL
ncbi:hypothetical protein ACJX0J_023311, partial [Zea mays]